MDFVLIAEDPMAVAFSRQTFCDAGITPEVKFTSKNDFAVMSMVQSGIGVAVLPELVISDYIR